MNALLNIKSKAHKLLVGFALLLVLKNYGQINLVPNPSFEQYTNCPDNSTVTGSKLGKPNFWYKPDRGGVFECLFQ